MREPNVTREPNSVIVRSAMHQGRRHRSKDTLVNLRAVAIVPSSNAAHVLGTIHDLLQQDCKQTHREYKDTEQDRPDPEHESARHLKNEPQDH